MLHHILDKYIFSWLDNSKLRHIFSDNNKPDIILTNKSDVAVALKYNSKSMIAPIILEKGRNTYAQKLINIGKNSNIPIVDDKELVNELYSTLKSGQTIFYKHYNKIARLYSKYTNLNITRNETINSFDEIFESQRLHTHEVLSLTIPEKIKLEVSSNIYSIVMNKYFKINICGFLLNNLKTEENTNLKNDEYNIKVNGLLVKNGKIIYTFIEPFEQLSIFLTECLKQHYKQLIGRDEIVYFLSQVKEKYPVLINEILKYYSIGEIRKVFHDLLEEDVSVQNIITILETMADFGNEEHNFNIILENLRKAIGRDICLPYMHENVLKVFVFESSLEKTINSNFVVTENGKYLNDEYVKIVHEHVLKAVDSLKNKNLKPVLVYGQLNRKLIRNVIEKLDLGIAVISASEIPGDIRVEVVLEMRK